MKGYQGSEEPLYPLSNSGRECDILMIIVDLKSALMSEGKLDWSVLGRG
jgi:hypothetical protein